MFYQIFTNLNYILFVTYRELAQHFLKFYESRPGVRFEILQTCEFRWCNLQDRSCELKMRCIISKNVMILHILNFNILRMQAPRIARGWVQVWRNPSAVILLNHYTNFSKSSQTFLLLKAFKIIFRAVRIQRKYCFHCIRTAVCNMRVFSAR